MTRKLTPEEKVRRYQTTIRAEDLQMAIADMQTVCNFSPKLSTKGTINSLKNTIRLAAPSLHPTDAKLFHTLTNWVLYRMEIMGWASTPYTKPSTESLLDFKVAAKVYTNQVLPTYKLNNYQYPYENVFKHTDADNIAWCVGSLMLKEKVGKLKQPTPEHLTTTYHNVEQVMKYIQLWCQLNWFDIRMGLDLREKNNKKTIVENQYYRLEEIEAEVFGRCQD